MIQNLVLRSCLVCSITLITLGSAVEFLKSSEFEDKEIPFLLNWKGDKYEKSQNIDGNWWRWVQEANERTITEETVQNSAHKNNRAFVFKRSVQPFRPNIDPLRSLFNSEVRQHHPNQKRWISTSFGFGSRKKSRKDSKQQSGDVQKLGVAHTTLSPKVGQELWDLKDRMRPVPQEPYIFQGDKTSNLSSKLRTFGLNLGKSHDIAGLSKDPTPKHKQNFISTKSYAFDMPLNDGLNRKLKYDRQFTIPKNHDQIRNLKVSTNHLGYEFATAGRTFGDIYPTRKISVDPRFWAKYTTETIFERVFQPYTELRAIPDNMKFPINELSLTSKQNTAVSNYQVSVEVGTKSQSVDYIRPREHSTSEKYPEKDFSFDANVNDIEETGVLSAPEKSAKAPDSNLNLDIFDQISIPSVKNTYGSVKHQQIDKTMKSHQGMGNRKKSQYKDGEVVNNVVPALKTRNDSIRKPIVIADEGTCYDMPSEEEDQYGNNSLALSPAILPRKANKNQTRNSPGGFNPAPDGGKSSNNNCGTGSCGSCGNHGGGVNISILMPNIPAFGSTVEHTATQTSRSTLSASPSDKSKKKKESHKKVNKNSGDLLSETVMIGRSDKLVGNPARKMSSYRRNNDSMLSNRLYPMSEQQRLPYKEYSQDSNDGIKTQYREIMAASRRVFESPQRNPFDSPTNNYSSWKYLDIVHQLHHSMPPTVFGVQTVGGSWDDVDDEDELKELYDEQNYTKTEENIKPTTSSYLGYGRTILPDFAKHLLYAKDPPHSALERIGVLDKLKNNNSGPRLSGQEKDMKFPSSDKKDKESPPKRGRNFDDLYDMWEKYSFPKDQSSAYSYAHERDKLHPGARTNECHHQRPKSQLYKRQRQPAHLRQNEETQGSDYYDQWEALDADLKNDLNGGGLEDLRLQVRNKKREVDSEDSVNDAQGFYRLSSGISLKNPGNMIISAIRQGKMIHERRRPWTYEEYPIQDAPDGYPVSAKPKPVTNAPS